MRKNERYNFYETEEGIRETEGGPNVSGIAWVCSWGKNGMSPIFKHLKQAKAFAQEKANKTGKQVEIETLVYYKEGPSDFSQGHCCYVYPN